MTTLVEQARARWTAWGLPDRPPVSALTLSMKKEAAKATTVFLLDDRGAVVAVAKAARSTAGSAVLRAEADAAIDWQSHGWSLVQATCPRVLALDEDVLWLSALPGRAMLVDYLSARHLARPRAVVADFDRAGEWLDELHEQTRGPDTEVDVTALGEYLREIADDALLAELFGQAVAELAGVRVGTTAVHGDFWMGNLLMRRGHVSGVVDLELSSSTGLPMYDVVKLPLSYALYLDTVGAVRSRPGSWSHLAGFEEVFLGNGHLAAAAERFVRGRMVRLGVAPTLLRGFLPLALAQQGLLQRDDPVAADGYTQCLLSLARHRSCSWAWRSSS